MRLQRGEEEEEEEAVTLTGGDKETSGVRRVLAPEITGRAASWVRGFL